MDLHKYIGTTKEPDECKIKGLKFGDIVENHHASKNNPQRISIFISYYGNAIRVTNGYGDYWQLINDSESKLAKAGSIFDNNNRQGNKSPKIWHTKHEVASGKIVHYVFIGDNNKERAKSTLVALGRTGKHSIIFTKHKKAFLENMEKSDIPILSITEYND